MQAALRTLLDPRMPAANSLFAARVISPISSPGLLSLR
jgi:hypothetical protein